MMRWQEIVQDTIVGRKDAVFGVISAHYPSYTIDDAALVRRLYDL